MIQIIKEQPSFGQELGQSLGRGLSAGVVTGLQLYGEMKRGENEKKELKSFADKLEENYPDSPMHKTIADLYRSNLPMDQKSQIVKGLTGIDPFKMQQQERLNKEANRKQYNQRIKEAQWESEHGSSIEERKRAAQFVRKLQTERDYLLGFEDEDEFYEGEEEVVFPKQQQGKQAKKPGAKRAKFDPKNPEHIARRDAILKKTKGDRKKAGIVLSKEFEL